MAKVYPPSKESRRKYNKKYWRENASTEKNRKLKERYGITLDDFDKMRSSQEFRCGICRTHEDESPRGILQVDHCHRSGVVRKLLCACCNGGLGNFKDDPSLLRSAANYIETSDIIITKMKEAA